MCRSTTDSPPSFWRRLRSESRLQSEGKYKTQSDLVIAGVLAFLFFMFPFGYLVLWSVRKRRFELDGNIAPTDLNQLSNAKVLALASLVFFWIFWIAGLSGIVGDPAPESQNATGTPAAVQNTVMNVHKHG